VVILIYKNGLRLIILTNSPYCVGMMKGGTRYLSEERIKRRYKAMDEANI
jgi:hypothetical protein